MLWAVPQCLIYHGDILWDVFFFRSQNKNFDRPQQTISGTHRSKNLICLGMRIDFVVKPWYLFCLLTSADKIFLFKSPIYPCRFHYTMINLQFLSWKEQPTMFNASSSDAKSYNHGVWSDSSNTEANILPSVRVHVFMLLITCRTLRWPRHPHTT